MAQAGIALFTLAIICEYAHLICPILRAWAHPKLRQVALTRPIRTMLLPALVFPAMLLMPWWWAWAIYWPWNIWHFGAQNYGVCRILGLKINRWVPIGLTAAIMLTGTGPFWNAWFHVWWLKWAVLFIIDFPHWLADITLSTLGAKRWWLFLAAALAFGCANLLWKIPRADHIASLALLWLFQVRWAVGIVHFDYSAWLWKFSDPQIRAAIGKEAS